MHALLEILDQALSISTEILCNHLFLNNNKLNKGGFLINTSQLFTDNHYQQYTAVS